MVHSTELIVMLFVIHGYLNLYIQVVTHVFPNWLQICTSVRTLQHGKCIWSFAVKVSIPTWTVQVESLKTINSRVIARSRRLQRYRNRERKKDFSFTRNEWTYPRNWSTTKVIKDGHSTLTSNCVMRCSLSI